MKIIFLEAVQNFGGSKRSFLEFAKQLERMGHDVLIVDFWGANNEFKNAVAKKNLSIEILTPSSQPFVISRGGVLNRFLNIFKYIYQRAKYKVRFKEIVKKFQPDYVCVNSPKTLDILSRGLKYKIDYYVRGWTVGEGFKEKLLLKKYSPRYIAISEATRHAIYLQRKIPLEDIRVLKASVSEHPVSEPFLDYDLSFGKDNPLFLLHAGTFIKTKGHHVSILIAKELKDKNIHFKMILAGLISISEESKEYYQYLKNMVAELNLENSIEFMVNNHDLSKVMAEVDILINPSYTEGLSRVCIEAMSKGKPVIANPVGGITDFVISGFSGFLVDFNNVKNYSEKVVLYYENPSLYKQHSSNAVKIINSGYLLKNINDSLDLMYK